MIRLLVGLSLLLTSCCTCYCNPPNTNLSEWSDGKEIRDFYLTITEGILETSYIRSQKAAHSNHKKAKHLCLYDVENANMLVRTILLDLLNIET